MCKNKVKRFGVFVARAESFENTVELITFNKGKVKQYSSSDNRSCKSNDTKEIVLKSLYK